MTANPTPEQVAELWARLDDFNQKNANLEAVVKVLEDKLDARERELQNLRNTYRSLESELIEMSRSLNAARQGAATAVRDHIAMTKD